MLQFAGVKVSVLDVAREGLLLDAVRGEGARTARGDLVMAIGEGTAEEARSAAADLEVSLEANPTDAEAGRFAALAQAGVNRLTGTGVMEAPRGTLFHEYRVDEDGILQEVHLLVATGNNNLAMNRTVAQIARAFVTGTPVAEGVLNRIEHGIRLYDPCLSCSTHVMGKSAIRIEVLGPAGEIQNAV